jgi:hypothetical protein
MSQTYLDPAASRRKKRRRALLAVLLSASILTLGSGAFSLAVFSDSDSATGSWTTGEIILDVTPDTTFSVPGIFPGDDGQQDITVTNAGTTGELRYQMRSTASNTDLKGLAAQMNLMITDGTCAGPVGATLYSGSLDGAWFGDLGLGDDPTNPVLLAGASDVLCFAWSFPLGSGNGYANATTDATFTFTAEQTANNP